MTFRAHKKIDAANKPTMVKPQGDTRKDKAQFAESYMPSEDAPLDLPDENIKPDDIPF